MIDFTLVPANARSIAYRSLVFGLGINDAPYKVTRIIDGKMLTCPFYKSWVNIMARCYSTVTHKAQPRYIGCTICTEWLTFSVFKRWMIRQEWEGNDIDKDIIVPGNKVYSPDNCVFVPARINKLLIHQKSNRGQYPTGVSRPEGYSTYKAMISKNGKYVYLGTYDTIEQAAEVYRIAKSNHVTSIALEQSDHRVRDGLLRHADIIMSGS